MSSAFRKLLRSTSLPETCDTERSDTSSRRAWWRAVKHRVSRSLTRVDDRSNSAAPLRRQPHPFAMHALGFHSNFAGGRRLLEWPPPDPPPLTPLNFGVARPLGATNTALDPPRPWWRRNGPTRPNGPVVHVTIDTTDLINPMPMMEHPTRILGLINSIEDENDREPRRVTAEETATSAPHQEQRTIELDDHRPHRAQLRVHHGSTENVTAEQTGNIQPTTEELGAVMTTEDGGMISVSSEEVQQESTFQVYFVVLDSNPGIHTDYLTNLTPDVTGLLPALEMFRQRLGRRQFDASHEDGYFEADDSNSH